MKKIAIIDDEKYIVDILQQLFNRNGSFSIESFSNPKDAIKSAQNGEFDLILLDIMMPQMNGLEFLKKLRDVSNKTKVIVMTAYSTNDKMDESKSYGADDFITKPFPSLKLLEEKVINLIG